MADVLILEDEEWRINWFREHYPSAFITSKVDLAIMCLERGGVSRLFLDHDLGTEPRVGRDVAKWLASRPDVVPDLEIIVHSVNVVSAPKILADLADGGRPATWIPFTTLAGAVKSG